MEGLSNIDVSLFSRLARLDPVGSAEVVAASAPQTLPSTRAGGQDDVSSNKLPQVMLGRQAGMGRPSWEAQLLAGRLLLA